MLQNAAKKETFERKLSAPVARSINRGKE